MSNLSPQNIVKSLIAAGYTQAQIEVSTGISQSSISRILTGTHTDPRHSTVCALEGFYQKYMNSKKA